MRVRLGEFVLDTDRRLLFRGEVEVHLQPKAYELLELLVRERPRALAKLEIRRQLWPQTTVGDASLTVLVGELRKALGDDASSPRFVRTAFAFGYAFAGDAAEDADQPEAALAKAMSAARVLWEKRVIPLATGDNVLGRDESVAVRIDAPGVSRHHACIRLHDDGATLADLGSKNGTYLEDDNSPIASPAALEDGMRFRLGRVRLVFRSTPDAGSTRTETLGPEKTGARPS